MEDKLSAGINRLGIAATGEQLDKLRQYARMVLEFNKSYNLMKAKDEVEMAVSHLLDSLAPVEHIRKLVGDVASASPSLADIGSGGGCPGIPLAILMDDCPFTLVERMEKRASFLNSVRMKLSLQNISVLMLQAEKVAPESFDIALFRAFHPFDQKISKTLLSLIKKGGFLAAYKARSEKIAAEMETVRDIFPAYEKIALNVPFLEDHERNLVVIRKG